MLADFDLINDFLTDNSSNVIMYADYTSILISNNRYEDINRNFNNVRTTLSNGFRSIS
jgi:hypothetical protein